jgi:hypothetical protein
VDAEVARGWPRRRPSPGFFVSVASTGFSDFVSCLDATVAGGLVSVAFEVVRGRAEGREGILLDDEDPHPGCTGNCEVNE